ncbi:MAG: glycosyltransferase family 2 protein [Chitinophagaceae bacterium]|nr:glycosyltransferase family 2 protein [Chitinophagaceae bacterium]
MDKPPSISVIVPFYNHAAFVQRRIESLLAQTAGRLELILLDDASTDNTASLLRQWEHHPAVQCVCINAHNSGSPFLQWQRGLQLARQEWVWIAEGDDYCDPDFIQALLPALSEPGCVLAYNEINWVDQQQHLIKQALALPDEWMSGPDFLRKKMLFQDWLVNAGMLIFRKSAAKHVADGWQQMKQAGDYWFFCEIARQGSVYSSGKVLASFVRHNNAHSKSFLYTNVANDETLAVLDQLKHQNIFTKKDIRDFLMLQLIGLETSKKGMEPATYYKARNYWMLKAKERRISITSTEIFFLALYTKAKHYIRTHILR